MKKNPLISVIVPIYKVEKYLEKCIESIINQTYENLEIILVDDGSPDLCGEICDQYALKDNRIKVIHKSNGGLSSARNAGLDISKGEYIGFVDSDDHISEDMYTYLFNSIRENNTKLAVCNIFYEFESGKIQRKSRDNKDLQFDFFNGLLEMNTYRLFDMGAWSKLYNKTLFSEIRFPEGKLSEDYFVMYRIFELAQKISYVSNPCYYYLQRKNSISRNASINHDFLDAAKTQMEYLDSNYPEMMVIGHTAYASAALTVYDFYLKSKVDCPIERFDYYYSIVNQNIKFVKQAKYLSKAKKIQFRLFIINKGLYGVVFKVFRNIKRV